MQTDISMTSFDKVDQSRIGCGLASGMLMGLDNHFQKIQEQLDTPADEIRSCVS